MARVIDFSVKNVFGHFDVMHDGRCVLYLSIFFSFNVMVLSALYICVQRIHPS